MFMRVFGDSTRLGSWALALGYLAIGSLLPAAVYADEVQVSTSSMEDIEFDHDDHLFSGSTR